MNNERQQGLKSLRKGAESKPKFHCENCKCNRYNPCRCTKSDKQNKGK